MLRRIREHALGHDKELADIEEKTKELEENLLNAQHSKRES